MLKLLAILPPTMLLACSLFGQPDSDDAGPLTSTTGGISTPANSAPVPYFGPSSIEERILSSVAIVRARLTNTTTEVVTTTADYWGDYHYPALKFTFSVSEYLYGSGADTITAYFVGSALFDTAQEAEDWAPTQASQRDSQFDGRDAVLFLTDGTKSEVFTALVQPQDVYLLSFGGSHLREDSRYWINDKYDRRWLPAASATAQTSANQQFLLEQPVSGTTPSTITLGALKSTVAAIVAEIDAGDGSAAYKKCLKGKYNRIRRDEWTRSWKPDHRSYEPQWDGFFSSGQPAGTELYIEKHRGVSEMVNGNEQKTRLWIDGEDADLFSVEEINHHPFTSLGPNVTRFDFSVVSVRPIPAGTYDFNHNFGPHIDCGYNPPFALTANVTAPAGVLHELFFDPVTAAQGQSGPAKVAADASNGVLEPASFTDANGASATIQSVSYEPPSGGSGQSGGDSETGTGTVAIKLTTHTGLANHALDFIALDGSVSLSLVADDATIDDANNTLSWTVAEQPWHDGDKLMVRIRKALPAPEDVSVSLSGGTYTISWSAVTGAADYRVQYRTGGSEAEWTDLDATTGTSQTFSPEGGVACSTTYEFRVQARGDGTTYPAEWSKLSESISHTNSAGKCNRPPVFDSATYTFTVSEDASVWPDSHVVGFVSASDPDEGDGLLYYITAGNGAGAFDISSGHDGAHILVWAALDYETTSSYTLTVEARDGKAGGTSSATVEITVTDVAE